MFMIFFKLSFSYRVIMEHMSMYRHEDGFITLMTVIIIVAVSAALAISVILMGVDSLRTGATVTESNEAAALADACAEEALEQIRSYGFTGTQEVTLESGTCSYTVINDGGESRTIRVTSTASTVTRRVRITIDALTPEINIVDWQDVAIF